MTDTSGNSAANPTEIVITGQSKGNSGTSNGPYAVNQPVCYADIYTPEGGAYTVESSPTTGITVNKAINGEVAGTFQIQLPPGGLHGPDIPPSWTQVLTPMSLVVIGMRRGAKQAIVMVGLITSASEQATWQGDSVRRAIVVNGKDFGRYFELASYYTLWFLATTGFALPQDGSAPAVAGAIDPALGPGYNSGRPDQIAAAWYKSNMAGGALAKTSVPYGGAQVAFADAVATQFEIFHSELPNAFAAHLLTTDNAWADKFKEILPYPWLEFFVTTAPDSFYRTQAADAYGAAAAGYAFSTKGLGPDVTASPTLVARVNPVPALTATTDGTTPSFSGIDAKAWSNLPVFDLEGYGFLANTVGFDETAILNYFAINPTSMVAQYGQSNAATTMYLFAFAAAGDLASIERYGFRPANGETSWLADPSRQIAQQDGVNDAQFLATLMARFCSAYTPLALMARATVSTFLRPDIMPGCVFRYNPWKNGPTWDFYIEAVSHQFSFGGASSTTLTLARGLPTTVYADQSSTGLLYQIHVGNAERLDGVYQASLPAGSPASLQGIPQGGLQSFFAALAKNYVTPQGLNATP